MADTRFQTQVRNQSRAEIDQGLRSYMLGVYNYMALGVALTAIITLAVAASPAAMATVYSLKWVFFIALLAMAFVAPRMIFSGNTALAHAAYWGYAAIWGLAMAPMIGTTITPFRTALQISALIGSIGSSTTPRPATVAPAMVM